MSVLVALATYNEIENLPSLAAAIHEVLPAADVIVVDDNSPDGTGRWCDEFAAQNVWFRVIHRPGKLGLGTAAWAAMRTAIERDYEFLATLDADWSHPPAALPELLSTVDNADVAIGSRYCPGGGIEGWPLSRRAMSFVVNRLSRWAIGASVADASGALRVYRVAVLKQIDFNLLTAGGYAYLEELLWRLHQQGARFVEVPFTFVDRRCGASKVGVGEAVGKLRTLLRILSERCFGGDSARLEPRPPFGTGSAEPRPPGGW